MTKANAAVIIPGKKDSEGLYTLLRVGGLSLLDRHLFGLYYHGVRKAYILDPGNLLRKWRFARKPEDMEVEVVETFPALEEEFYLIRGDAVFHKGYLNETKPLTSSKGLLLLSGAPADGHKWWTRSEGFPILDQDHYVGFARVGHGHIPALSRALEVDPENGDLKLLTQLSKTKECEIARGPGPFFRRIDSRADVYSAGTLLFHSLRKPQDGLVARTFNRPMSLPVSRVLAIFPITPNQLSVINGFFAVAAGFFLAFGHHLVGLSFYLSGLLGGTLMQACSIYDGCDGEVARVKFQFTHFGDWLDTIIDDITNCIFFAGVAAWAYLSTGQTRFIYMGIAAFVGQWIANIVMYYYLIKVAGTGNNQDYKVGFGKDEDGGLSGRILDKLKYLTKRDFHLFLFFLLGVFGRLDIGAYLIAISASIAGVILGLQHLIMLRTGVPGAGKGQ